MSGNERFGPYRILRELGAGGMGRVSLAEREGEEAPVVVKRMNAELAADARFRRRLLREAEVAADLQHPNVVRVLDTGVIDDQLYLTMEYVPGSSLSGVLAASRPEPLPLVPVLHAVAQACDGLAYVHRFAEPRTGKWMELVHRDVSLDNLLVSYAGEVKVADFGIVKTVDGTQTTSGVIMGKLGYMSPEQIRDETLDASSDMYSLGVCLFELLAGRRPLPTQRGRSVMEAVLYDPPPPLEQLRPDVPPTIAALVARMLSKERKARPASCEEVAKVLRAVLAQRPEPTLFPSKLLTEPPRNRARPAAQVELATEVEVLAATRPQRLVGAEPPPGARREPPPAARPTPLPGPNAPRKLMPAQPPDVHRETVALAPDGRRLTPTPDTVPPPRKPPSDAVPPAPRQPSGPDARRPTPPSEPEHSVYSVPTRAPTPKAEPASEPEHSVYSVPTRAPTPRTEPASEPEHSVYSVPTRVPPSGQGAAVGAQSTRLLAAAPSRRRLRRWAALGGLALLGAAACWWWV